MAVSSGNFPIEGMVPQVRLPASQTVRAVFFETAAVVADVSHRSIVKEMGVIDLKLSYRIVLRIRSAHRRFLACSIVGHRLEVDLLPVT